MVKQYAPLLTRFAYDLARSREMADDAVSDVFVWIWEHRTAWQVRGSLRAYLFRAVRNRIFNAKRDTAFRERWRQRNHDDLAAAGIGRGRPWDPGHDLDARALGVLLRRALARLPEGRRTALILRWIHGLSYAEIAQVVGTSVVGVKQQLNRALRELRATLPDVFR
jgi:RNA polymerase sigma-70 factor (ECF subfamily)